ncbi:RAMP superfamily CRISPR-associated protein [Streptomyces sp. P9(2023)]|uniref:RAMP superfamily CRISPR-associated protein n=1 Tax=Streptomyces sp. P9(2023) TaxID=3064394 RepID=UPI0028F43941|nr:RAMP superfamily CRISPR-associated protein [Streptomyces sp. P9(2023)]MDT9692645.1 RAMP superfamily CRISPR-associated protein [Streptomyces sp. P9(2023)]
MTTVLLIALELELESYAAVKAPESAEKDIRVKHPLTRDGHGHPYIPASSLAGSLRAHVRNHHTGQVETLLGEEPGTRTSRSRWQTTSPGEEQPSPRPSAIRFLGTRITPTNDGFELAERGRTAMDRHRAAPANHKLRTDELLPPGSRISCWLRIDDQDLHAQVLTALADWRPTIGGDRSTGLGRARVSTARYQTVDLDTPEGRARWLTLGGEDLFAGGTELDLKATQPDAVLRASWEIVDGLSITAGDPVPDEATGRTVSRVLTGLFPTERDGRRTLLPYVPGSTWKGVLRSRVEYILRSLGIPVCDSTGPAGTCGNCDACTAFGWAAEDIRGESAGQRALLHFADSPITDAPRSVRQHVALDRFTGGAADGLLYAREVVDTGHLTLAITRDPDLTTLTIPPVVLAALRLACYDLHAGLLGLGGATTRGLGTLRRTDAGQEAIEDERRQAADLLAAALTNAAASQGGRPV